ncbi:hypothetical protein P7K49_001264 [Saguinus oedipus]|uniref:ADP/ATP translocase n=1 Tax=Saguinus oedipus TaxID=9490 RepID=A0ABQ9WE02_SAGOE|nr:hypothetical protein P7K49_001264 [Saguinus oedipus]
MTDTAVSFAEDFLADNVIAAISKMEVKLLLQVQHASKQITADKQYKGIIDCMVRILKGRESCSSGMVTWPMSSDNSPPRLSPLPSKINTSRSSWVVWTIGPSFDTTLQGIWHQVVPLETHPCVLCTPLGFAHTSLAADVGKPRAEREFRGLNDCLVKLYKSDGIKGLYQGFNVSVQSIVIYRAVNIYIYDTVKGMLPDSKNAHIVISWMITKSITAVVRLTFYPFDTAYCLMMMQSQLKGTGIMYTGTLDCWRKTAHNEAGKAFFKGAWSNVLRRMGGAFVLVLYDEIKKYS